MAQYIFDVRNDRGEITANHKFQEECFNSIRSGNPLMFPINKSGDEITCLEYILDAVIDSGSGTPYVDEDLFSNLAHPTINLDQNLCHEIDDSDTPSTCIPKIIDAYVSVSSGGFNFTRGTHGKLYALDRLESRKKVSASMKQLTTRYYDHLRETNCRPRALKRRYGDSRDYLSCFEKLIFEGVGVDFIDVNAIPVEFFNTPMCHEGKDILWCYDDIVTYALSSTSDVYESSRKENCRNLLLDMIHSKKFEWQLYDRSSRACGSDVSCMDKIVYAPQTVTGVRPLEAVLSAYTNENNRIDDISENSPFSGSKCKYLGYDTSYENCMQATVRTLPRLFSAYDSYVRDAASRIGNLLISQPRYANDCGNLRFLSALVADEPTRHFSYNDAEGAFIRKEFSTWDNMEFKPVRIAQCVSSAGGKEHEVSGMDYALELGTPITYLLYNHPDAVEPLLKELNKEPCKSIVNGEPIPCLQKLTKELIINYDSTPPQINGSTRSIIEMILNSGGSGIDSLLYPDGKPYFTDYVTESIYHSIIVNSSAAIESIGVLDSMIRGMATHADQYSMKFADTPEYNRVGKIYDIIDEANRRYPDKSQSLRFKSPSIIRQHMNNAFIHTEDNVKKAIGCGLFSYGKSNSIVNIFSSWYHQYKGNPEITGSIESAMDKNSKKILSEYFKTYIHSQQGVSKPERDIALTPESIELFEHIYHKPMSEYFKPSLETRILYDEMCFSSPGVDNKDFLDEIYDDVPAASELRHDSKNIVGVYDVSVGKAGEWSRDHILRYAGAISKILYGSDQVIGEPYIIRSENMRPVPVGLIAAIDTISEPEFIGKRTDNVRGKLKISVFPVILPPMVQGDPDYAEHVLRSSGNDFMVEMYYEDTKGIRLPQLQSRFPVKEALQKLPKKIKNKLQEKYPYLFGQLDAVLAKEADAKAKPDREDASTYKLVISNKPADIIRASACQQWDSISCMSIFGGSHNDSLESYIGSGSYIAYLTKKSEYEPQWLARLFMHKCRNCNCVSIQDRLRYYEIERSEGRNYPNWHILYDAVKTVLADKGVNKVSRSTSCDFTWGGNVIDDIAENGDPRCDEEMDARHDSCIGECEEECDSESKVEDYFDEISGDVQDEINRRFEEAKTEHTIINDDGEEELDIDEDELHEDIENEVREGYEDELLSEKIQDCKDGCDSDCEDVNSDFDCLEYLEQTGMLDDEDSDVWTDSEDVKALNKDSQSYKGILLERTGQEEDSTKFVRQVTSEF